MKNHEAIVITAHTGCLCCKFSDFHEYAEKVMGRPVYTHEMASESFMKELKEASKEDFMKIVNNLEP